MQPLLDYTLSTPLRYETGTFQITPIFKQIQNGHKTQTKANSSRARKFHRQKTLFGSKPSEKYSEIWKSEKRADFFIFAFCKI